MTCVWNRVVYSSVVMLKIIVQCKNAHFNLGQCLGQFFYLTPLKFVHLMTQTKLALEIIMTHLWFLFGMIGFVFMMLQEATNYYFIFSDSELTRVLIRELIRTEEALNKIR